MEDTVLEHFVSQIEDINVGIDDHLDWLLFAVFVTIPLLVNHTFIKVALESIYFKVFCLHWLKELQLHSNSARCMRGKNKVIES